MRIVEDMIGKEVINSDAVVVGKVGDVEFDEVTQTVTAIVLKKGGISETLHISKKDETIISYNFIKSIGDKILLKDVF